MSTVQREIAILRKSVWPMREVVALAAADGKRPDPGKDQDLSGCHDHAIQAVDTMEVYRDMVASIMDLYRRV
jgi:magnesium transporter